MTETITVASRVVEVQSRSAERSFAVDSTAITNLAINSRDPLLLARLAPGVADATGTGMNVNGSRDNTHNITVDGVSNVDTGNNGINGHDQPRSGRGVQAADERAIRRNTAAPPARRSAW